MPKKCLKLATLDLISRYTLPFTRQTGKKIYYVNKSIFGLDIPRASINSLQTKLTFLTS